MRIDVFSVQQVLDAHDLSSAVEARIPFLHVHLQLLSQRSAFNDMERRENHEFRSFGIAADAADDIFGRVALHFLAAHGRERPSDACIEQAHVLVNLSGGAHG